MEMITKGKTKETNTIRDVDNYYDQFRRDQAVANLYISATDGRKQPPPACNSGRPGRGVVQ